MKKVILIGYMGSGKSVVSKKLENYTGISAVDLDKLIEKNNKMSVDRNFFKPKVNYILENKKINFFLTY